jgi:hypothetical protein
MSEKGGKARRRPQADETISVLPMELQVGDRFTDYAGEWEIVTRPTVTHGGKTLRAKVRQPGQLIEREMNWPAYVKIEIRRGHK